MRPKIAITMGDPAGIGPEVVLKALAKPDLRALAHWTLVGDRHILASTAVQCGLPLDELEIRDPGLLGGECVRPGTLCPQCGIAAMNYVRIAAEMCLAGEVNAMVTAPLNKEAVTLSGQRFSGHTEYIAEICGVKDSRMLLWNERLAVVHVSTHVSLRRAIDLRQDRIVKTIQLGYEAMQLMGKREPRVAVCGLNPHAGEHGLFGSEDAEIIQPAVQEAHARQIPCQGPMPPDTVFLQGSRGAYDLIVAMYHDQGHIPMKLISFEETVNISLGIPILRTSVDHGTAFDIAGKNLADPRNMAAAMKAAVMLACAKLDGKSSS